MAELTIAQKRALAVAAARLRLQGGGQSKPQTQEPKELAWSDVPGEALRNTPASAGNFIKSMVQPVLHPIDTANSMLDLAAGGISRGIEAVAGDQSWLPENQATATADAVGGFYKDRYGSVEGFKKALATDPIGIAADASTVLTGGAGLARGVLGAGAKTTRALETASRVANPVTPVAIAGRYGARATGAIAKPVLGATTGTSSETIGEAYRAGREGGATQKAFADNLRGKEPQDYVIGEAKSALNNIAQNRSNQYQNDMRNIGASGAQVDLAPVRQKLSDLIDESFRNGHQVASDETIGKLQSIANVVDEWSADPSMHDAIGVDTLKRRIDDLMPSFTEAGNAERVVTVMRDVVKQAIVEQVPEYADAMRAYEVSKNAQKELERALSIKKNNAADTTLRKLQSVTRNNASTNYGSRLDAIKELEAAGGKDIMARLSGQALNTWTPRGIMKPLMAGAGVAGYFNPAFLGAVPLASPRLVGEGAKLAGALARRSKGAREATPEALLLARLLGDVSRSGQQ